MAVDLPDEVRDRLLTEVPRTEQDGVRWVDPRQWHVTLRFLGDVDEPAARAAVAALRAPAADAVVGPRVSRLGRHVVCLPVAGLDDLATAVRTATDHLGEPEGRRFAGHLTLARLRHRAACGVTGTPFSACFTARRVTLYRSTLGPTGAVHDPLVGVELGGPPGR